MSPRMLLLVLTSARCLRENQQVLGDHGMTPSGDHGGDSAEEVEAALFLYSKRPLWNPALSGLRRQLGDVRSADQIGLAPTLALLLGLPVPFGSLGSIIPEVFAMPSGTVASPGGSSGGEEVASLLHVCHASSLVSQSIRRYLLTYQGSATDLDSEHHCNRNCSLRPPAVPHVRSSDGLLFAPIRCQTGCSGTRISGVHASMAKCFLCAATVCLLSPCGVPPAGRLSAQNSQAVPGCLDGVQPM